MLCVLIRIAVVYQVHSVDGPRLTCDISYSKAKFVNPCICMVKMLKSHFLKMYERLVAET